MTVALLTISDGRDSVHAEAHASLQANVPDLFEDRIVHIDDRDHELGFCGAVQAGWDAVLDTGADYVFHFEADFTFNAPVPLERMVDVLSTHKHLAQLVLKRQPWNADEKRAGGIVEQHPGDYRERVRLIGRRGERMEEARWTEHRRFWSTNPGVYSTRFCRLGWPQEAHSEGLFTHRLLRDPTLAFAFWGGRFDPPLVEHIGHERIGVGY